jgi:hypothetical protein
VTPWLKTADINIFICRQRTFLDSHGARTALHATVLFKDFFANGHPQFKTHPGRKAPSREASAEVSLSIVDTMMPTGA